VIFGFREISMDMAWKKSHFDMEIKTKVGEINNKIWGCNFQWFL